MISKNNIKRRAVAAKKRNHLDAKAETIQAANEVPIYPGQANQNIIERQKTRQERGRSYMGSSEKSIKTSHYFWYDRESILFFFLAVFGAAFVVIGYFSFSIAFGEPDDSCTALGKILKIFSILFNKTHDDIFRRERAVVNSSSSKKNNVQFIECQETQQTYFSENSWDETVKRPSLDITIDEESNQRYFGVIDLDFRKSEIASNTTRRIMHDSVQMLSDYRDYRIMERDDDQDNYYAYDDDYVRNPFSEANREDEAVEIDEICCRRISEHRLYFPNCNSFHETPLLESEVTYIGAGSYRLAMRLDISFAQKTETVVVKDIHLSNDLAYDAYEFTRMDAIVAERLTASRRTYSIYGTCGIGILSEYFPHGQLEEIVIIDDDEIFDDIDEEERPLLSYNNMPGLTKLKMSLHMAEALADLHGYSGGVIVHQDIKLDQFFLNANRTELILNDFNRAEFLLWDQCNNEYCGYKEGFGMGNVSDIVIFLVLLSSSQIFFLFC